MCILGSAISCSKHKKIKNTLRSLNIVNTFFHENLPSPFMVIFIQFRTAELNVLCDEADNFSQEKKRFLFSQNILNGKVQK